MKNVVAIGEALIDFIPAEKGCSLREVVSFTRVCGGAPCNVAAAVAKLGGHSRIITQLGNDAFGDFIVDTLNSVGVNTSSVLRTAEANTALAFVSLKADGDRDFSFYRNPSADMLFDEQRLDDKWFENLSSFHFCSVDLVPCKMREAHKKAILLAQKNNALISFDPNIRFPLWNDVTLLKATILEFMDYADIAKISDEELEFITDEKEPEKAIKKLFSNYKKLKAILYSCGKSGAKLFTRNTVITAKNYSVKAVDTTGAGDSIIGSFLFCLAQNDINADNFEGLSETVLKKSLDFANACSSLSVTEHGAIQSYADMETIKKFIDKN